MPQAKISFRVPPGLWQRFAEQAKDLFLNRAPFLDHLIQRELQELERDLGERRLSTRAKRHISGELKRQGAKSINIEIAESTAAELNRVMKDRNLVRDAFLCRLLIFLRGTDTLLGFLDVPTKVKESIQLRNGVIGLEAMPTSPMRAMEAVRDDPMFYVRNYVEHSWNCGIYCVPLPRSLDWAACILEDKDVPGTKAFEVNQRESAELYEALERDALSGAAITTTKKM
jgi:hypothetical protein